LQITPQNIQFLFQGVKNDFDATLNTAPIFWDKFADLKTSTRSGEAYYFTDLVQKMRLWFGDRVAQNISARAYLLQNNDYELTLEVDRNRIQDDAAGVFAGLGKKIAIQGARWPDQLVVTALQLGDTTALTAYDGLPFFNAAHLINPDDATQGTQSNLYTSAGSGAALLSSANYLTIRGNMRGWKGANGQPIGVMPDLMIVPPLLETAANQINNAAFTAPSVATGQNAAGAQQSNVLTSLASTFVNPYLSGADTTWFLADTKTVGAMLKPFIFQQRQAPTYVMRTSPTDPAVFDRKVFLHGIDARGNVGVTFPFLCVKAGP
jgi:phage major head subunit gpT-like protein